VSIIGIDLGGTKVTGALFDANGNILNQANCMVEKRSGDEVGNLISDMIISLKSKAVKNNVEGIGISVPGIYYAEKGTVWAPNIKDWDDYPLKEKLSRNNELKTDTIIVDSDRACYVLGEVWKGNAQNCRNVIFIAIGTGIGAGILVDGIILRGHTDIAGAIGWFGLNRSFDEKYAACGHFEYYCSGEGLIRLAKDILIKNTKSKSILSSYRKDELTTRHLFNAYESNDNVAIQVFKTAIEYWGMAAANLVSAFNPQKIIFGGGVFGPADQFLDSIYKEAKKMGTAGYCWCNLSDNTYYCCKYNR